MASRTPRSKVASPDKMHPAIEFKYESDDPVSLAELASSFQSINNLFNRERTDNQFLSVIELRSGSIVAVFAPYIPFMNDVAQIAKGVNTVYGFSKKLKDGLDAFSGRTNETKSAAENAAVAAEIAQIVRPLTGKKDSNFSFTSFRYRSKTSNRTVEIEASYNGPEIDRALINAERLTNKTSLLSANDQHEPTLLHKVRLTLHQANSGPAKEKGQTGDKGVIETESDKELPVYFAKGVNNLKDKIVKGNRNPLKGAYIVDAVVTREDGIAKCYTVIEVHSVARVARVKDTPLLKPRSMNRRLNKS